MKHIVKLAICTVIIVLCFVLVYQVEAVGKSVPAKPEAAKAAPAKAEAAKDVFDTAVEKDTLKTLVNAIKSADLVNTLKGKGPFTLFAATDEAFGKLMPGTLDNLLKPENKAKLTDMVNHHIVSGKLTAKDLSALSKEPEGKNVVKTVQGQTLTVKVEKDGAILLDDAKIVGTEISCANGVIHLIDKVLLPKEPTAELTEGKETPGSTESNALQTYGTE